MSEKKDEVLIDLEVNDLLEKGKQKAKKTRNTIIVVCLCLILGCGGFVAGFFFCKDVHPRKTTVTVSSTSNNATFQEIEAVLEESYLYGDDYEDLSKTLENKAYYGMSQFDNDPYTTYMSKEEMESFTSSINMNFVGIGVVYTLQDGFAFVNRVVIDSPAEKAGILAGDILTAVDGESIQGLTTTEIKERVVGEEGTIVTITVKRDEEIFDLDIPRGQVDNSVYCYQEGDYIVMELYSFGSETANECMNYLDSMTNLKKIIIDLRDDGGGYQSAVKQIAGLFIGSGKVYLQQAGKDGVMVADYTTCSKTYDFDKIVILVDENTASAAEVFTICLKESLDNVTIIGNTTYGKGVIQSTHYLANGGALKYTSYNWYSPNGVSINGTGITPDVLVMQEDIYYEYYNALAEDETYTIDSVSDVCSLIQKCLKFLDYEVTRTDGYFDESFANVLNEYKVKYELEADSIIDKATYDSILSKTISAVSKNYKDRQMEKAVEIISQ